MAGLVPQRVQLIYPARDLLESLDAGRVAGNRKRADALGNPNRRMSTMHALDRKGFGPAFFIGRHDGSLPTENG